MSTISLRLPDSLHAQVRELALKENVSINQLITLALAEKLSALMTEEYLAANRQLMPDIFPPGYALHNPARNRQLMPDICDGLTGYSC